MTLPQIEAPIRLPAGIVSCRLVLWLVGLVLLGCTWGASTPYGGPLAAIGLASVCLAWFRTGPRIVFRRFVFALAKEHDPAGQQPLSGKWLGYWEQGRHGRQAMTPLELQFENGRVHGHGLDCVGPFTFEGSAAAGELRLMKQYLGQHSVLYVGRFESAGNVRGAWWIWSSSGAFELWPVPEAA